LNLVVRNAGNVHQNWRLGAIHSHTLSVHLANTTKVVRLPSWLASLGVVIFRPCAVVPCSRCAADSDRFQRHARFVILRPESSGQRLASDKFFSCGKRSVLRPKTDVRFARCLRGVRSISEQSDLMAGIPGYRPDIQAIFQKSEPYQTHAKEKGHPLRDGFKALSVTDACLAFESAVS